MNFGAKRNPPTLSPRADKQSHHCLATAKNLLQTSPQSVTPFPGGGMALRTTTTG